MFYDDDKCMMSSINYHLHFCLRLSRCLYLSICLSVCMSLMVKLFSIRPINTFGISYRWHYKPFHHFDHSQHTHSTSLSQLSPHARFTPINDTLMRLRCDSRRRGGCPQRLVRLRPQTINPVCATPTGPFGSSHA